ncbi:hypothetical protein GOODEAATRI_032951 [Goodea atripinnis]|uniref:TIR domain-containing protein n=1 Tax=Goodea atripinnis TaxID=208336 RepID=A0ABV0MX42_9TELE
MSRLVTKLTRLTHLDVSRTSYSSMPHSCTWPSTLRYLNISRAKLATITPCNKQSNVSRSVCSVFPMLFYSCFVLLQSNTLNVFGLSDLQSYKRLENLEAGHNKFVCSCEFVTFLHSQLVGSGDVKITDGKQSYVCDSPLHLQGEAVSRVNLSIIQCWPVLFVSVSCGVALFFGMLVSVLLWRCHTFWYLKMTWAWLKAKRGSQRRWQQRNMDGSEPLLSFDAFVSYSEKDASWVEDFLVPALEEPR